MNELLIELFGWAYILWPVTLILTYGFVIPAIYTLAYCFCSWIDDDEKTFKYPDLFNFKGYGWLREEDNPVGFLCSTYFCSAIIGLILWAIYYKTSFIIPLWILLVPLPFILVKKVFKLGKAFKKHVTDKDAHSSTK